MYIKKVMKINNLRAINNNYKPAVVSLYPFKVVVESN